MTAAFPYSYRPSCHPSTMASPLARARETENMQPPKDAMRTSNASLKRLPLAELATNAKVSTGLHDAARKPTPSSPLKRSSVTILDDGRGLQYLKRRKLSDAFASSNEAVRPVHEKSVRSETARFRPVQTEETLADPGVSRAPNPRVRPCADKEPER